MCATDRADGIFFKIQCSECKIKVGFLVETEAIRILFFPLFFIAKSEDLCIVILFLYI